MMHHLVSAPKHPDPGVFNVCAHRAPRSLRILGLDKSQDLGVLLLYIVGSRPRGGLRQVPPQVDSMPDIVFERSHHFVQPRVSCGHGDCLMKSEVEVVRYISSSDRIGILFQHGAHIDQILGLSPNRRKRRAFWFYYKPELDAMLYMTEVSNGACAVGLRIFLEQPHISARSSQ
jgi:hypothetical protein